MDNNDWEDMIDELLNDESGKMNGWECDFVEDLDGRRDSISELTDPQYDKLREIYDKVFG